MYSIRSDHWGWISRDLEVRSLLSGLGFAFTYRLEEPLID
jgi:hypothetical protein